MMILRDQSHIPVALTNPTSERLCLRGAGGRAETDARAEPRRGESQRNTLDRRDDAPHVLACHGRHVVLKVHLERELERYCHHGLPIPQVAGIVAGRPAPPRGADLECRRKIKRAVRAGNFLHLVQVLLEVRDFA